MVIPPLISEADSESLSLSTGRHLRRELQSLISASEMLIPPGGFPTPAAVHDIRVNMKRGRAILKLLRVAPGIQFYSRENAALRDISALFSSSREADVLRKTIRYMAKKHPDLFGQLIVDWFDGLAGNKPLGVRTAPEKIALAADASARLVRAWYRVGFLNLRSVNRNMLLDGLLNSFLRAEANYHSAKETELPVHIHELRKRIKDLLYQVRFFSDYNPDHFGRLYNELDKLASILGKCNDLAVAIHVASVEATLNPPAGIRDASEAMERERKVLFRKALPEASHLFTSFYSGN